jgi:hypothetical protein
MLTQEAIRATLSDLENRFCSFMMEHFACWKQWAEQSDRLLAGTAVAEDEVPESFRFEYRLTKVVMEMDAAGAWDWNNPKLRKVFEEAAGNPLYRLMAETITESAIRLCAAAGVKTLLEVGAGKGHLTGVMAGKIAETGGSLKLIVTDTNPAILQNIDAIKSRHSSLNLVTEQWDINQAPPQALLHKIEQPCLVYDRASIIYTAIPAIKNIAGLADAVVFGDMINYTGQLYGYDEIFKKLGVFPLFYRDLKPVLDECFREHFFLDARAQQETGFPTTSILIAYK